MAEIGGESDEVTRNIITAHRALLQDARCKGMTQIMDTRSTRSVLADAGPAQYHMEVAKDSSMAHRFGIH